MKKVFLITNPISGTRSKRKLVPKLVERLRQMGYEVTSEFTRCAGDATSLATRAVSEGYDAVAVCGGDGTVNETAKALCGTGVPMAIIPSGSGNGLARHIGIPVDEIRALKIMAREHIDRCDYGLADGRHFFCTFGVGFDAEVSHEFASRHKRGLLTYVKSALYVFRRYKPREFKVATTDGEHTTTAYFVTCCNASQYGNDTFIDPHGSIRDGRIDIVEVRKASFLRTLLTVVDLAFGMLDKSPQTSTLPVDHAVIDIGQAGHAHLDGEPVEMPARITVDCVPGGLLLFTNPDKKKFRPVLTPLRCLCRDMWIRVCRLFRRY